MRPLNPISIGPSRKRQVPNPSHLRGDLDNIVLKSLRKEPERRYVSVEQLSEDIRRHLRGLPVAATPDSISYRAGKFVRRNKVAVIASAIIILAVLAGSGATLYEARVAEAHRRGAERRFNDVRKLANSVLFEFHDSIQDLPGATPARKLIVERALQYLDDLARESREDPNLQRELASAYKRVGDVQGYPFRSNLGDTAGALRSYQKALAIREPLANLNPDNITDKLELAVLYRRLAEIHSVKQNITTALTEGQKALQIGEGLVAAHPQSPEVLQDLIKDYQTLAGIEGGNQNAANLGDTASALVLCKKAAANAEQLAAAQPADRSIRRLLASTVLRLGDQLAQSGERQEAGKQYLRGKEIVESLADSNNVTSMSDLADAAARVGTVQLAGGDTTKALPTFREGLNIYKSVFRADPSNQNARLGVAWAYASVGQVESMIGHHGQALPFLKTAIAMAKESVSVSPTAESRSALGLILVTEGESLARYGNNAGALHSFQEALSIYSGLNTEDSNNLDSLLSVAATHNKIGMILLRQGEQKKAARAFANALLLAEDQARPEGLNAQAFYVVAEAYAGLGDAKFLAASDRKQSRKIQIDLWRNAESLYEQSLKTWSLVKDPGIVSPEGFDSVLPAVVARQYERCQAALKRFNAQEKSGS